MSPLRNRVSPMGQLIADPARGAVYGNRGCLHDAEGRIRRDWAVRRWIACRLEFKGWQRGPKMQPGRFTELFFLDEATAFAAGHRPCALCRREDYRRLQSLWPGPSTSADDMDDRLHAERLDGHARRLHDRAFTGLPDGAFVLREGEPWAVAGPELMRWTPGGYRECIARPGRGTAQVITPPSLLTLLEAGWDASALPLLDSSARR